MNDSEKLIRTIHPEVRVVDREAGIIDYIASDETLDHYQEVIRAKGWRFTHFQKNAPFVDSHDYHTIGKALGKVLSWEIEKGKLIERVQWAIDVPDNTLARLGWQMTVAGYLRAVSVGFYAKRFVTKWDSDKTNWTRELGELGMHEEDGVRVIYIEQEQVELSACVLGANPNALAKALHAKAIDRRDLDTLFQQLAEPAAPATSTDSPDAVEAARHRAQTAFLLDLRRLVGA